MKRTFFKLLDFLLITALIISACFCTVTNASAASLNYKSYTADRGDGLKNTASKLAAGKEINVLYFGGSITNGGAATPGNSWRELTGKWLTNTFPNATINNINVSYSGTGTWFGLYRLNEEIIKKKPDLIFIEFGINDAHSFVPKQKSSQQFETIVRQLRKQLPECDIVNVLTTDEDRIESLIYGMLHEQAEAHDQIAKAYGIPTVYVGQALADTLTNLVNAAGGDATWQDYWGTYVNDNVHPTNNGHKIYFNAIKAYLKSELVDSAYTGAVVKHAPPRLINDVLIDGDITYIDVTEDLIEKSDALGGTKFDYTEEGGYNGSFQGGAISKDNWGTFVINFTGTELTILADGNNIENFILEVDGKFATAYKGQIITVLVSGLKYGKHTVKISPSYTVGASKHPFDIYGFFVRNQNKATSDKTIPAELRKIGSKYYYYYDGYRSKDSALVKHGGKWFYVKNGVWDKTVTGFVKYENKWFYVKGGKWNAINDLVKYQGKWFYISGGKWDKKLDTLHKKNGKFFAVVDGKWYKGKAIIRFKGKSFYVNNGFAQLGFSGKVKIGTSTYTIKKGKVT